MAEFSELVRIKKRICAKYKHNGNCKGCPVGEKFICGIISITDYDDMSFKVCEDTLLSWAAEHPEPVYPMWGEWLAEQGIVNVKVMPVDDYGGIITQIDPSGKMYEHISADIAEKLGIKPKEG